MYSPEIRDTGYLTEKIEVDETVDRECPKLIKMLDRYRFYECSRSKTLYGECHIEICEETQKQRENQNGGWRYTGYECG